MPSPRRHTLRATLARSLAPKLLLLAAAFAYIAPGYIAPTWDVATDAEVMEIRPTVDDSPAALVAEHDCWTSEGPEGVIAGHVVVTVDGVPRYAGERMVGKSFEQIFDGTDHGLTVHGFCR